MSDFPKTITQTLYLQATENAPTKLELCAVDMGHYDWVLPYGPVEVTIDVPANLPDPTDLRVSQLRKERDRVQSEASEKLAELNDRIERLQAITYTPEAS